MVKRMVVLLLVVSNIYQNTGMVTNIDNENDIVTVTDFEGKQYEFEEVEDWMIGDYVLMTIDNNGTLNDFEDDKIINARYIGYDVELCGLESMEN